MKAAILSLMLMLTPSVAASAEITPPPGMDVYVLGEVHDNPAHHAEQARLVALIAPRAVVWEMLSPAQVAALPGVDRGDAAAMDKALGWSGSGWPEFALYHPVFVAAGAAEHSGASAPRGALEQAMKAGLDAVIGTGPVAEWGLGPLSPQSQAAREAEQMAAHCNALPPDLLPGMVEAQRLRDWYLAGAAVAAVDAGQGPVVVITGTGHARKDRGVPALIAAARPGMAVWSLGQVEADPGPSPPYDAVNQTDPAPREDPCLTFERG